MARIGTENGSTPCYSLFSVVLTDPTWGLLSRGSQVRVLAGAPFLARFCRLRRLVTTPAVTSRRSDRSHRTDD